MKKENLSHGIHFRQLLLIIVVVLVSLAYGYFGMSSSFYSASMTPYVGFVSFAPTLTGAVVNQMGTDPISTSMLIIALSFLILVIILLVLAVLLIHRHHRQIHQSHQACKDKLEPARSLEKEQQDLQVELTAQQKKEAKHLAMLHSNLAQVEDKLASIDAWQPPTVNVVKTVPVTRGHDSHNAPSLSKEKHNISKVLSSLDSDQKGLGRSIFSFKRRKSSKKGQEDIQDIDKSLAKIREDLA